MITPEESNLGDVARTFGVQKSIFLSLAFRNSCNEHGQKGPSSKPYQDLPPEQAPIR